MAYNDIVHYWNMKEHVFLSNNQGGIVQDYWIIHFLNITNVLTNRVNCSGNTFILTLFWRVLRDLCALLPYFAIMHKFETVKPLVMKCSENSYIPYTL